MKLFRKIRQRLVTENKVNKYLVYATGEILLVMIGILIALQVNNWNIERQNKVVQNALLHKLDSELQSNIDRLDFLTGSYEGTKANNQSLYDSLLAGTNLQNVEKHFNSTIYDSSTLNLRSSAYEQMKNTGQLYTLNSDLLLNAIELHYKLWERENYYILKNNERVETPGYVARNIGFTKAKLDYFTKGLDYALRKNTWLLNKKSDEYAARIREVAVAQFHITDMLRRMDRIINDSKDLKDLIKKTLDKEKL